MIRDIKSHQALLDVLQRYVNERLRPLEDQVAEEDDIPEEVVQEMREMGLFGLTIPEAYGGLGMTMEEEVEAAMTLGGTSPAFRSLVGTNNGIGSAALVFDGTDEQRERFLPKLASGECIASFCLTEPDAGSDSASLTTRARLEGDHYILNGTKRFITNAPRADLFTVLARTDPEQPGARGISAFVVEANSEGISLGAKDKKMGHAGSLTCDVNFDEVAVPKANLIGGEEGKGFYTAMKVVNRGRLHIAALSVGIAQRLLDDSLRYATERKQFGKAIAEHQLIQAMLADSKMEIYAGQSMVLDCARKRDDGLPHGTEASCSKLFCTEMVGRVADRAVQVHGGSGYIADYGVERFYRDVRLFRLYEGTSQIQQMVIAKNLVKEFQSV
ncbi:acyl-CoA dehydrogenase family protein [Pseudoteredinibacter isoporae]|uniref:Acyl-CoA dehydrogenase n=1 Tax=Pseudoteredinibacter isoporae TaxID=570281 RepID=A0A7X0JWJ4_9GAMM|nr:acyl-CoA dehydrogenase [Pseudoteredinibacter isoporae]NHO88347.1 acyl-CoA dehydrogenase [Pseudoteredinibacter isoporae]NIB23322.1 acyl-CoA dehydrogenase [Pseudoteredinibacter isoporae]